VMPAANAATLVDDLDAFDIVAAAVPVWRPQDPAPSFAAFGLDQQPLAGTALAEAWLVGTGCIAIRRRVLERFATACLDPFEVTNRNGLLVSEDVSFCELAQSRGFKIACDFRVQCDHWMKVSLRRVVRALA
jgi:hypothetical protein